MTSTNARLAGKEAARATDPAVDASDRLLDSLGGKVVPTTPPTDRLSGLLVAWRQTIDAVAHPTTLGGTA